MANIKISELNELTQEAYDDYLPIVDSSADETKKISVKNLTASGVQLIDVTDTEPEEGTYQTGDKYYNTTDNKIYTATSSGWANPQTPIENIFYIILDTQNIYTYNGQTLVSVGGGAGGGDSAPIGQVSMYAGSTAPDGFLMCDGSAVSRETYKDLYRVIGTTYGSGDGSTTFNLPDIKGKVVVMLDANDTDFDTLGETGGSKTHKHLMPFILDNNINNFNKMQWNTSSGYGNEQATANNSNQLSVSPTTESFTGYKPYSEPVSSLQPYIVLNYIIKVQKLAGEVLSEQLPVGTEVDFDGSASDIPIGWEQVSGKSLVAYELYSNASGTTGTVTLNDDISNYEYIEIYSQWYTDYTLPCVKLAVGKIVNNKFMISWNTIDSTNKVIFQKTYNISGTSITKDNMMNYIINTGTTDTYDVLRITKVIGYKEV